jgi:acyl phosphate:glycerol-3-phosphate acyltransferase
LRLAIASAAVPGPVVVASRTATARRVARGARIALAAAVGYLAGTGPSAAIATRLAGRDDVDLRRDGSGNPGALNASRVLGRRWGAAVFLADAAKGAAAAVAGRAVAGDAGACAAATASIAGHNWPVWTGFRGGKGVATSAGASVVIFPAFAPVDAAVAAFGATVTRRADRATAICCAARCSAAAVWWWRRWPNAWGPSPGPGVQLFAVAGSAMVLRRFAVSARAGTVTSG